MIASLTAVTKDYTSAVRVLEGVDLHLNVGDFLAITGPSGSGKSTLLNILGLLDRPSTGSVQLNGVEVSQLPDRHRSDIRARSIGFVFQQPHLIPGRSAVENVRVGLAYSRRLTASDERRLAGEVLAVVGLSGRLSHDPDQLSGGEAQRVALARAIAKRPQLLLCDEPTGNLDEQNTRQVMDTLENLLERGVTEAIVVVTHDPLVAGLAYRRVRLHHGRITET